MSRDDDGLTLSPEPSSTCSLIADNARDMSSSGRLVTTSLNRGPRPLQALIPSSKIFRCFDREPSSPPHSSIPSITTTGNLPGGISELCFSGSSTRLLKSSSASVFSRSISLFFNLVTIALLADGYSWEMSNATVRQKLTGVCTVANSRWKKNDDPKRCDDLNLDASFRAMADFPTPGNPLIQRILLEASRSSHHSSIFNIISSRVPSMHSAVGRPRTKP